MSKIFNSITRLFGRKKVALPQISDKCSCYVLITCDEPSGDGDMQVEMTYEGDEALVSYLVKNAQNFFKEQDTQELTE